MAIALCTSLCAVGDCEEAERADVAAVPALSVTFTLKLEEPALVGVPLNTPAVLSVSPAGNVPLEMVQFE